MPERSAFQIAHARYRRRCAHYYEPDHVGDVDDLLEEPVDFSRARPPPVKDKTTTTTMVATDARILRIPIDSDTTRSADDDTNENAGPVVFGLHSHPGFLFFPGALSSSLQYALAYSAVTEYCQAPHRTNMDSNCNKSINKNDDEMGVDNTEATLPCESMWDIWKQEQRRATYRAVTKSTQKHCPPSSSSSTSSLNCRSFRKLSWATLGYHYDWTARAYHRSVRSSMPIELTRLARLFARQCPVRLRMDDDDIDESKDCSNNSNPLSYNATACIVNYYSDKSVMGGHRDDLEEALSKPIVSLSLGRPAVFLLGGSTLDSCEPVVPVLVRSGDVMILGGPSRLCYHSMVRVLPVQLPEKSTTPTETRLDAARLVQIEAIHPHGLSKIDKDDERKAISAFLAKYRINITLRQVFKDDSTN